MTELCLPLTLVLACLAVVAAVVAPNLLVARRKRVALWRSLGRELGMEFSPLRLDGVMQLTGQVGRRKVSVYETGSDRQVVHIVPIISLPRRLELSARRSVVRGGGQAMKHPSELTLDRTANEDVKTYLANERVWKTMSTFLAEGGAVQSGTLVLEGVGTTAAQVSALIGRAVEVARALERERVAPWEKLGALDGLNMTVDGNWYDVPPCVSVVVARSAPRPEGAIES